MTITIKSSDALATINSKGAELESFIDVLGFEYIWQKDAKYWANSSPMLFPIVGNLRDNKVLIEGNEYSMDKHGFCRYTEFKVIYQSEDKVILNYTYNEETLKMYPYKFSLSLTYSIKGPKLTIKYDVINLDDKEIFYCLGAHPAFNVPVDGNGTFSDYCLKFNKNETANTPVYDVKNLCFDVNNRRKLMDDSKILDLSYDMFDDDAILLDTVNSNNVMLVHKAYNRGVSVDFNGFTSIAFWTPVKKSAPFLCIEPWNGMAVCSDEGDEFTKKRGTLKLDISEQKSHIIEITPM